MNEPTTALDQTDEDALSNEVSDEALESASGTGEEGRLSRYTTSAKQPYCVDC